MSAEGEFDLNRLFRDRRINAALGWAFVVVIAGVVVAELARGDPVTALFGIGVAAAVLVVPLGYRSATVMLPWEVVALASLPTVGKAISTWAPAGTVATYLAVAAVALMIAVELHAFTPVSMTYGFAALFVLVTTLAAAGIWAVARWLIGIQLGIVLVESEHALMVEFVHATVAGVLAAAFFRPYFRRTAYRGRLPEPSLAVGTTTDGEGSP